MTMHNFIMRALDTETDYMKFEKIATGVMYEYGYTDIVPLGGSGDMGMDALETRFYEGKLKEKVVFQFTMSSRTLYKLKDTINKSKSNKIDFSKLVLVTSKSISGSKHKKITELAESCGVYVVIYDQKVICECCMRNEGKLWLRHYPDPIKSMFQENSNENLNESHKTEILKGSFLFFEYKKNNGSRVFLEDIVASCCATNEGISHSDVKVKLEEELNLDISIDLVKQIISSLEDKQTIFKKNNLYFTSKKFYDSYTKNNKALICKLEVIGNAIIQDIIKIDKYILSDSDHGKILALTKLYIVEVLKGYATEIMSSVYNIQQKLSSIDYINMIIDSNIFSNVSKQLKGMFILSANRILTSGDNKIDDVINDLAIAYSMTYAIGIDPYLHELHRCKIQDKTFVLDTDFILECIVRENIEFVSNYNTLKSIANSGAKVYIPYECILECAKHAEISQRTYDYFGESLISMPKESVEDLVLNVFVKGYYYARLSNENLTYNKFLNNYHESSDQINFMTMLVRERLPFVEIIKLDKLTSIDEESDEFSNVFGLMLQKAERSRKAQYRNATEIKEIAILDTKLFFAAVHNNTDDAGVPVPYSKNTYIITKSHSFVASARMLGINHNISTTKKHLTQYINMFEVKEINKGEIAKFIFNPISQYVISQHEDDIRKLAKLGFDLADADITRLNYDIDKNFHNLLSNISGDEELASDIDIDNYAHISQHISDKGYRLSPVLSSLVNRKNQLEEELGAARLENESLKIKLRRKIRHIKRTKKNR